MLRQGSDSISRKSPCFLIKQGFLCLMAMKIRRVVKTINSQVLMKKNLKFFPNPGNEHAPKNLVVSYNFSLFFTMKRLPQIKEVVPVIITTNVVFGSKERHGIALLL